MNTRRLKIDARKPDERLIAQAAEIIRGGGLVAFPTETVYGLGAAALNPAAVQRIFEVKGRPPGNPLIVHVAQPALAQRLVAHWPPLAARLVAAFWPGPLTLVLRKDACVPDIVTAGADTVALRMPAHPVALALLRAADVPIAAPSANPSQAISPTTADHVWSGLGGRVDLLLDAGPTPGGIESTVLDLTAPRPRVLRPGLLCASDLADVLGADILEPALAAPALGAAESHIRPPSPGQMARHYAPAARLLLSPPEHAAAALLARSHSELAAGWMTFLTPEQARAKLAQAARPASAEAVLIHSVPKTPAEYAAQLYAMLHALDAAGVALIIVEAPPPGVAWDAIRDRLQRASQRD